MIPYFSWVTIAIGPIHLYVWGLFAALGVGLGTWVAVRQARRAGLNGGVMADIVLWVIVGAFMMARLVHIFAYAPEVYLADPLKMLRVWEGGLSSFGGFLGGMVAAFGYMKWKGLSFLPYAECVAYALPLGYGCGRIGCFLIHDHPGTLSQSFLAVQFPDGARLDHGLLLAIFSFAMFVGFLLWRKFRGLGGSDVVFLPTFLVVYGVMRFVLDFFRASDLVGSDVRYWLFTPAQYGCVVFVFLGVGIYIFMRNRQRRIE
jgi:phosphatidylglycerol:prolipoprotein diacylglycerol transferase